MDNAQSWLEVSLTVDGEMAEAVAEVLSRFAPNGVVIESTAIDFPPASDFASDVVGVINGPLRVYAYLPLQTPASTSYANDTSVLEDTRRELEEALWHLGFIRPLPAPQYQLIQETNWMEAWQKNYRPIPIGRRLMIVPAWLDDSTPGRVAVRIDPGMAFGTGTHPTTQLCLEFLEDILPQNLDSPAPVDVIDVGSGSGILSIAALKLGARHALGVDTDPNAVAVARANAALNGVSDALELGTGSLAEVLAANFSIQRAPLVMANILAPIIIHLLDNGLANLLERGGSLVLSGILQDQLDGPTALKGGVLPALARHDLVLHEKRQVEDWVALLVRKK